MIVITAEQFRRYLEGKLGRHFDQALSVFMNYGSWFSVEILSLYHDTSERLIGIVTERLQKFCEIELIDKNPQAWSTPSCSMTEDEVKAFFREIRQIYEDVIRCPIPEDLQRKMDQVLS